MEAYRDAALPVEERVADLLGRMTLEEKAAQMDMIRGVELATKVHEAHFCSVDPESDFQWDRVRESLGNRGMGFVHDVYSAPWVLNKLQRYLVEETRLGIPCIFTGEALHGISYPGATIFPMPIALGATFDPEVTEAVGAGIAAETRCLGIHEILAPNLDVAREPRWGRVEETFGEDTYLSSRMAYAIVTGEQGEDISRPDKVVCEPKHYCVHGMAEGGTNCSPARAGVREVETAYLPVFEAGIRGAGAYNAMAAYNCIDGEAVIASRHYLREVLKERFGLKGYVRADFGAVRRLRDTHHMTREDKDSIAMAINAGLDVQGFDFPNAFWENSICELVREGRIPLAVVDEAVARVLRVKFELGLFEHPYADEERYGRTLRCAAHQEVSLRAAREALVLLHNDGVLPLGNRYRSIALLGPSSGTQRYGSYSSVPYGYTLPSLYQELRAALDPGVELRQCDGCGISDDDVTLMPASWFEDGVRLEYFANDRFQGEPVGTDRANQINFNWILAKPHRDLNFTGYSVRMSGAFTAHPRDFVPEDAFDGRLIFTAQDSVRVYVDGRLLIDSFGEHKQRVPGCDFRFVDGERHAFVIEFVCDVSGNSLTLSLDYRGEMMERAVELARQSEAVVLVCGDDKVTSGEGMDRCDLRLYGKQRELVERVCALGKPTVLVLENGKPVDLSWEAEHCNAILTAWFGGERGALAISDALLGRYSPGGRLPISFPRSVGHLPCYYTMLPGGSDRYLEGPREALFPFGHGLSYCRFRYGELRVEKLAEPYSFAVAVEVENLGEMTADEVVQLYVTDLESSVVTPERTLQGFRRITLAPGEKREVRFRLGQEAFRLMDVRYRWVVEPGAFRIAVGASSQDIRAEREIMIE